MARKNIYGNMYSTIDMNTFPGEMKLPGKTVAQQAKSVDYQDIPRDIQAMRQAEYKKEVKEGEFMPEFGSAPYGPKYGVYPNGRRGLGGYLGDAAKKTAPGLLLAGAVLALYWIFSQKKEEAPTVEEDFLVEAPAMNPEEEFYDDEDDLL
jgi:hypothetical protein